MMRIEGWRKCQKGGTKEKGILIDAREGSLSRYGECLLARICTSRPRWQSDFLVLRQATLNCLARGSTVLYSIELGITWLILDSCFTLASFHFTLASFHFTLASFHFA